MLETKEIAESYATWFAENINEQRTKLKAYCWHNRLTYDDDIFYNTYLNVYEKIASSGIRDATPEGFDKYFFLAFKNNTLREEQYCRNRLRNNDLIDINRAYETYYNKNERPAKEKILSDLRTDFYVNYLFIRLENAEEINPIDMYCFKVKNLLEGVTYKKLVQITSIKDARTRVLRCKRWLQENVKKEEIEKAFETFLNEQGIE